MLGYQNSCSKATLFESCECRAETEDHWFGAFSATWCGKQRLDQVPTTPGLDRGPSRRHSVPLANQRRQNVRLHQPFRRWRDYRVGRLAAFERH